MFPKATRMLRKLKMQNASLCIASIMNHTVYLIFLNSSSKYFPFLKNEFDTHIFNAVTALMFIKVAQTSPHCAFPNKMTEASTDALLHNPHNQSNKQTNKQQTKHLTHQTNKRYVTPTRARHKPPGFIHQG